MDVIQKALVEALEKELPAAVATVVKTMGSSPRAVGAKMIVYPDGRIVGSVGGGEMEQRVIAEAQAAIREGKPRYMDLNLSNPDRGDPLVCGGEMELFIEPLRSAPVLVIAGAGHVGAACAELGRFLGFRVVMVDDRPEILTADKFPQVDERHVGDLASELRALEITARTCVVLVTRAHTLDAELLAAALDTRAGYIGMLGSRRRVLTVFEMLKGRGVSEGELARVHAPIGLDIHAETPQEIAVSIMGEVIRDRAS